MNAQPITITATVACWISKDSYSLRRLGEGVDEGDGVEVVEALAFYGKPDRVEFGEWVRAGEADVTVRLIPKDQQTRLAVQALEAQLAEERVKWHQRQEAILAEIHKLQAIEYTPADTIEAE
jgi:hypothetical protein